MAPELAEQLTHPLALLLWVAAVLSFAVGNSVVAIAVLLVIVLNAAFALVQELQAERAVEALAGYLPQTATVIRDHKPQSIDVGELVPGDIVMLEEGGRVPADVRLIEGAVEVDVSTLTGESAPVLRSAELIDVGVPRLQARDLGFMGATCTEGDALAVVFATGMHTELGSDRGLVTTGRRRPQPVERQVRRVAWLIAAVAIVMAIAFVPVAVVAAGLSIGGTRSCSRSACWPETSPKGCSPRSPWRSPWRSVGWRDAAPWSSASAPWRRWAPPT